MPACNHRRSGPADRAPDRALLDCPGEQREVSFILVGVGRREAAKACSPLVHRRDRLFELQEERVVFLTSSAADYRGALETCGAEFAARQYSPVCAAVDW